MVDPPEAPEQQGGRRRQQRRDPQADREGERRAGGELPPPLDDPHGRGREGEQVRAEGHGPDHQDRRPVEHPDAGHDTGGRHEEHVEEGGSGVLGRSTGDLGPDRQVTPGSGPPPSPPGGSDARRAPEHDVIAVEVALAQELQHDIGDVVVDLAGDLHHVPRRASTDDHMPYPSDRGQLPSDRSGPGGRRVGTELQHPRHSADRTGWPSPPDRDDPAHGIRPSSGVGSATQVESARPTSSRVGEDGDQEGSHPGSDSARLAQERNVVMTSNAASTAEPAVELARRRGPQGLDDRCESETLGQQRR
jgi:hypothetical protein